ncbi:MAG TPA: prolyl oligopeptidase family serine peptidase, partial [Actinomycetota bacterium]|nr:prolyl oligopeptidase family serine peptidase [Actinomycetota bacterium]
LTPRVMQDMGEDRGGIVVSPRGRGTSTWYVGRGHADFLEVWDDVFANVAVDPDRVYVSGHSMGGFGSYLLSILYPDRFAAALPVAGPVTQGAWTGADVPGCDGLRSGDYSPCYIATNGSDPRVQHTRRLLENLRNVPIGIFHGAADELVPVSGVTRQVERLAELGYRHRYYLFPTYEHYTHPVADQWAEGVRYMDSFRRDRNPGVVSYIRDMPFERTVEIGPNVRANQDIGLNFDFDRAYWMSELTPADPVNGVARFWGRTHAMFPKDLLNAPVPEAGGPASLGQTGPYTMSGIRWESLPRELSQEPENAFVSQTWGASAVRLDTTRMGLDTNSKMTGFIYTDRPLEIRLDGAWTEVPEVTWSSIPVGVELRPDGVVVLRVSGTTTVQLG